MELPPPLVLVVDDSGEVREFIALLVCRSGCRALKAEHGLAARAALENGARPALVITDLEMPICDGWETLAFCHERYPAMPVLVVSGAAFGRRPEIERWAAGFLSKPFAVGEFQAEIQRLVCLAA